MSGFINVIPNHFGCYIEKELRWLGVEEFAYEPELCVAKNPFKYAYSVM